MAEPPRCRGRFLQALTGRTLRAAENASTQSGIGRTMSALAAITVGRVAKSRNIDGADHASTAQEPAGGCHAERSGDGSCGSRFR